MWWGDVLGLWFAAGQMGAFVMLVRGIVEWVEGSGPRDGGL